MILGCSALSIQTTYINNHSTTIISIGHCWKRTHKILSRPVHCTAQGWCYLCRPGKPPFARNSQLSDEPWVSRAVLWDRSHIKPGRHMA